MRPDRWEGYEVGMKVRCTDPARYLGLGGWLMNLRKDERDGL